MTNDTPPSPHKNIQDLALSLAVYSVRNTIIEEYHVAGKLSNAEMKALNIEVSNKLFTALSIFFDPRFKGNLNDFNNFLNSIYPDHWDRPVFDPPIWNFLKHPFDLKEDTKATKHPKNKNAK